MSFFSFYCQPICKPLRYIGYEVHKPLMCTGIHIFSVNFSKAINLVSGFSAEQQPKLKLATDFLTDDFIITRIVGLLFCRVYFTRGSF